MKNRNDLNSLVARKSVEKSDDSVISLVTVGIGATGVESILAKIFNKHTHSIDTAEHKKIAARLSVLKMTVQVILFPDFFGNLERMKYESKCVPFEKSARMIVMQYHV